VFFCRHDLHQGSESDDSCRFDPAASGRQTRQHPLQPRSSFALAAEPKLDEVHAAHRPHGIELGKPLLASATASSTELPSAPPALGAPPASVAAVAAACSAHDRHMSHPHPVQ
jgi:hypothetical protein